jgi:hypothetical protein
VCAAGTTLPRARADAPLFAAAQPAAAEGATLGKRKAEEEAGAEPEEEEEAGACAKEAPAPFEPLHLGPKTFTSAELCFRYFSSLLATQTMHQDCNQARAAGTAAQALLPRVRVARCVHAQRATLLTRRRLAPRSTSTWCWSRCCCAATPAPPAKCAPRGATGTLLQTRAHARAAQPPRSR